MLPGQVAGGGRLTLDAFCAGKVQTCPLLLSLLCVADQQHAAWVGGSDWALRSEDAGPCRLMSMLLAHSL